MSSKDANLSWKSRLNRQKKKKKAILDKENCLPQTRNQLLLFHEEVQEDLAGVVVGLLNLLHIGPLLQGVQNLLSVRTGHISAALSHHVQVFPCKVSSISLMRRKSRLSSCLGLCPCTCAQNFVCHFLEKGGDSMLYNGVPLVPVLVIIILLDLLLLQLMLLHHELTEVENRRICERQETTYQDFLSPL